MLAKALGGALRQAPRVATQAARGQARKMSIGDQLAGVKDVKVKDAARFFSEKMNDPAAQAAARVSGPPPFLCARERFFAAFNTGIPWVFGSVCTLLAPWSAPVMPLAAAG